MKWLSEQELAHSCVVSNCRMNRERGLEGPNSYTKELGFHPLEFLAERLAVNSRAAWLDLCCGSGRAIVEAAVQLERRGAAGRVSLVGVDMAPMFARIPAELTSVKFITASLPEWRSQDCFDLITCVHGLHYVGDKLGVIAQAAAQLSAGGMFVAHIDPMNLRRADSRPLSGRPGAHFRRHGLEYDRRRRLLRCRVLKQIDFPWRYLGADDLAGPNSTGQEAIDSYYEPGAGSRRTNR
jgi:SAM-dependent methyltransferase